ncbi:potassium channel protein [Paenibacillus pinistramenti]|uniref:potassium channel protein n=1 Tax=Paenibacillus pinistramenti TaxID=1768003 RepID=UPI001EEFF22E|nr:potassium channel family protein [Paenibacillus pinistramenti]
MITRMGQMRNTSIALIAAGFILLSATAAFALEPATFGSWFNALYWVLTTMATVGYGDYFAKTPAGKGFTIFLYIFGIGLLSLIIGKVIDLVASLQRQRGAGTLTFRGTNHMILINWSRKARAAVEEILAYSPDMPIVIIDESDRHPMEHLHQVHFISGDPALDAVLEKANLKGCRAAIIFADSRIEETSLIDGKSLLIVSSIERLAPHVHTTVEITQEKNIRNFQHAQVNEFVLSHDAISRLAVRSALQEGSPDLIQQLLSRSYGDDIYEIPVQSGWRTYGEAFQALLQQGATLLADRSDLGINRRLNEPIPADARLYIVADAETYRRIAGK